VTCILSPSFAAGELTYAVEGRWVAELGADGEHSENQEPTTPFDPRRRALRLACVPETESGVLGASGRRPSV